jgi:hypothetical protein
MTTKTLTWGARPPGSPRDRFSSLNHEPPFPTRFIRLNVVHDLVHVHQGDHLFVPHYGHKWFEGAIDRFDEHSLSGLDSVARRSSKRQVARRESFHRNPCDPSFHWGHSDIGNLVLIIKK